MQLGPHDVHIPKEIWRRLTPHDGLLKAAADFVKCCKGGIAIPRIYKPSGYANDGSAFQPYVRLVLWHHHLHQAGDPLLVTQHIGENSIVGIALTTHAEYFASDKMLWLQERIEIIDWSASGDVKREVLAYKPSK